MDWSSLILIGLFFGLPLLQRVLEQARRSREPIPSPDELPHGAAEVEGDGVGIATPLPSGEEFGWSEGWMPWPLPTPEEVPSPDARSPEESNSVPTAQRAEEMAPIHVAPPSRAADLVPVGAGERRTRPTRTLDLTLETASTRSRRMDRAPTSGVAGSVWQLDSAADLRRAIILKEVLGPPVALRGPGQSL